ncbi:hypothetical protein QS512_23835 [Escherichia coli]|nr:hypothetical protein [Salmonella enterica subsp. enterica serovar Enteritidis]MDL6851707.1 hypothetical protein [Escherichia coli]
MFHTIVSIKNDGHYFCRAGGNRPDGLNEPVTYEIYEANLFDMAMNHLSRLPLKDRPVFIGAAARKGLFLTMEETRLAREAKDALMAELALEY